ncbi:hypothetical protein [Bradyrhizobium sp. McL0616]|uniref:hypothetical protein n=1 Tax=Bradyrhizobium sp. McL0616 TaxID=3415674 RepID=UPI003CF04218
MASAAKCFADAHGLSLWLMWGVTRGVGYCRFEELFAAVPGLRVFNVSEDLVDHVAELVRRRSKVTLDDLRPVLPHFKEFAPGSLFSWDLRDTGDLARRVARNWAQLYFAPAASLRRQSADYVRRHGLTSRLGIRVRVTEVSQDKRRPHREPAELEETVKSLIAIPWHVPVFVVTDSEFVQQMMASHFANARSIFKAFETNAEGGRFVKRMDRSAMMTFVKEVDCLCHCGLIASIGGFLNQNHVKHKILAGTGAPTVWRRFLQTAPSSS